MKITLSMAKNRHGPPGGLSCEFKNARGDSPEWINSTNRALCEAFWRYREIWLTCKNSVCQDFLFLYEGEKGNRIEGIRLKGKKNDHY